METVDLLVDNAPDDAMFVILIDSSNLFRDDDDDILDSTRVFLGGLMIGGGK